MLCTTYLDLQFFATANAVVVHVVVGIVGVTATFVLDKGKAAQDQSSGGMFRFTKRSLTVCCLRF